MDPSIAVATITGVVAIATSLIAIHRQSSERRHRDRQALSVAKLESDTDRTTIVFNELMRIQEGLAADHVVIRAENRDLRKRSIACEEREAVLRREVETLKAKVARLEAVSGA